MKVKDWLILAMAAGAVVLALRKLGEAPAVQTEYQTTGAAPGADAGFVWI